ncbi:MAG: hypothetical protein V3T83_22245 [Acidobacteriota bacterium]
MDSNSRPNCPECGSEVDFGMQACPHCSLQLSWPGQERAQGSFARPGQEALGCLLVPLTSLSAAAVLAVVLAGAFAFFGGRYGSLVFGLAAIWLVATWLKRRTGEDEPAEKE